MCYECVSFARGYVWYMNLLFNILGLVMIIGGVVAMFVSEVGQYLGRDLQIGTIALGVFIIVLGTLAMCGSTTISADNRCSLKVYIVLLSLLIIGQGALVVVAFFKEGKLKEVVEDLWKNFEEKDRKNFMEALDCGEFAVPSISCGTDSANAACFNDCYEDMKDDMKKVTSIVSIVGICIMGYELLMLLMAFCVVCEDTSNQVITTDASGKQRKMIEV